MVLDRIAQIALIFFGALLLVLLVLGLAVSCRETAADPIVTVTAVPFPVTPVDTSATQVIPFPSLTPTTELSVPAGASPTPTTPGGDGVTAVPGEGGTTPDSGVTAVPGATPDQSGPTATPPVGTGSGMVPGATARHAVSRGEWLLQIARCYGVAYESLRAANYIPNPDYILPGAIVTVPNIGSQGPIVGPPCVVTYNVVAGDTWDSLAQRYRTSTAILQRANPGALSIGRSIWVPRMP